jgi:hypothetical protein
MYSNSADPIYLTRSSYKFSSTYNPFHSSLLVIFLHVFCGELLCRVSEEVNKQQYSV